MNQVHVVLPNDIDDPATPSGGNTYDRKICRGLAGSGWWVHEHAVRGGWPRPTGFERARLAGVLAALPDHAIVLLDGMLASAVPQELCQHAERLRLVVVMHLPLGDASATLREGEQVALWCAAAVITTSEWTRQRLRQLYSLPGDRIQVAIPGVDSAPVAPGSGTGSALLCVGAVTPVKGHDVLARALATVADLTWTCVCVGPLERDPEFVAELHRLVRGYGLQDRLRYVGPRTGAALDGSYAAADLLVLASRGETFGLVVIEALARAIPVLATDTHGLPEAMGRCPDGDLPGLLVPPGDVDALGGALRAWLGSAALRERLRRAALARRATLPRWAETASIISKILYEIGTVPGRSI